MFHVPSLSLGSNSCALLAAAKASGELNSTSALQAPWRSLPRKTGREFQQNSCKIDFRIDFGFPQVTVITLCFGVLLPGLLARPHEVSKKVFFCSDPVTPPVRAGRPLWR